jgi:predicted GNAT family N-acyltransferase
MVKRMSEVEIRRIYTGTEAYKSEIGLRDRVLRIPLGLSIRDDDLSGEPDDFHFGAFSGGNLIGVLLLTPVDSETAKIRQVAVEQALRGAGAGTALVAHAEAFAKARGFKRISLHSRKTAVPFYKKLGYTETGGEFTEVTIRHQAMIKELL